MGRNWPTFTITAMKKICFDRLDYKLSAADTLSLNLFYTRSWFQTPNSYDAQNATAWTGLDGGTICQPVCTGGIGPNGLPVGPTDQRSQINTYNIAPTWSHVIGTNAVLTLGAFLRQDQYIYARQATTLSLISSLIFSRRPLDRTAG